MTQYKTVKIVYTELLNFWLSDFLVTLRMTGMAYDILLRLIFRNDTTLSVQIELFSSDTMIKT